MYKIRVILDTQEDVIRTLSINEQLSLQQLHYAIAHAFGFSGEEMASFYRTDQEWHQGEEIPLFNMEEIGKGTTMASCTLKDILVEESDKLLYVYDFLNMWSFYVELVEKSDELIEEATLVLSIGDVPEEAPKKEFKADIEDPLYESLDDFDNFERLDDFDFDNY